MFLRRRRAKRRLPKDGAAQLALNSSRKINCFALLRWATALAYGRARKTGLRLRLSITPTAPGERGSTFPPGLLQCRSRVSDHATCIPMSRLRSLGTFEAAPRDQAEHPIFRNYGQMWPLAGPMLPRRTRHRGDGIHASARLHAVMPRQDRAPYGRRSTGSRRSPPDLGGSGPHKTTDTTATSLSQQYGCDFYWSPESAPAENRRCPHNGWA